ncbi:winged helix-turn-helix transcriptional regulator [Candidatus Azambacteria bacterium]|nr:winged helix-turn-helix transcriptional regulator [Candidatus Azambacteria bacterium]MBI3685199.1 winged helix-turn-helix transcriptional regulator [Candidatus Azambacteria bacterium]
MTFEQFFSSEIRARLVKFFLLNHGKFFQAGEIARRLGVSSATAKTNLKRLVKDGFLKSRSSRLFSVSYQFPYLNELRALISQFPLVSDEWILEKAKRMKRVKLLLVAGALIHAPKARVEVFIVGDKIRAKTAERFMREMEAIAAKELRYALMTTQEFLYRKKMFDRFVLDTLEFPHRLLVNKLKIQ